jgi:hypothetical protein
MRCANDVERGAEEEEGRLDVVKVSESIDHSRQLGQQFPFDVSSRLLIGTQRDAEHHDRIRWDQLDLLVLSPRNANGTRNCTFRIQP